MICASCGAKPGSDEPSTAPCGSCSGAKLLDGRYRLEAVIGQGALAVTYRAVRLADGLAVCVKELRYRGMGSFEPEELFRREARVLRQLHHPAIPAYIDDFTTGSGKSLSLVMVQELVVGTTLAAELTTRRYREKDALAVLKEMLGVLEYLHGLSP